MLPHKFSVNNVSKNTRKDCTNSSTRLKKIPTYFSSSDIFLGGSSYTNYQTLMTFSVIIYYLGYIEDYFYIG